MSKDKFILSKCKWCGMISTRMVDFATIANEFGGHDYHARAMFLPDACAGCEGIWIQAGISVLHHGHADTALAKADAFMDALAARREAAK